MHHMALRLVAQTDDRGLTKGKGNLVQEVPIKSFDSKDLNARRAPFNVSQTPGFPGFMVAPHSIRNAKGFFHRLIAVRIRKAVAAT